MMDYQKELELFLDYYVSDQSSYIRDAVELDKSFHVINVPKLLAVSGLAESYVFRLKDSWNSWVAAKAQAVPEGFVLVDKHQLAQLMANMDSFGKKALGDDYVSFADIAAVLDEAQEPAND